MESSKNEIRGAAKLDEANCTHSSATNVLQKKSSKNHHPQGDKFNPQPKPQANRRPADLFKPQVNPKSNQVKDSQQKQPINPQPVSPKNPPDPQNPIRKPAPGKSPTPKMTSQPVKPRQHPWNQLSHQSPRRNNPAPIEAIRHPHQTPPRRVRQ